MYSLDSYFSNIINEKHCLSLFKIDKVAKSLMPSDVFPISFQLWQLKMEVAYTKLFAISMILICNCQLKYELRLKTVKELNSNVYDNEELNLYSTWDSFEKEV